MRMKHHFCSSSIFNIFQLNTYNRFLVVVHELYGFLRYLESLFNARKISIVATNPVINLLQITKPL